ncbi:hypothetical protein DC345_30230 [Paenibacillus taichungensis]|uniref:Uncharacterized protein n=1 Tax=Paenibacillus taichungensis TaxID=484184 RepID=A0A329QCK7_9BACL|nr:MULTISPECIES: hypothetical protein [Paenibacillus]MCZ1265401.1 hypothetical protein [Paenibacillus tundrae]RAW09741.1 hypothetical protein DC345_30230 [Paenibacillus taichungensis]
MKKALAAFALTSALVIPSASFASAETVIQPVSSNQSEVTITNLGQSANDSLFASQSQAAVINKGSDTSVITPMSTDGQNIYYEFKDVSSNIWSDSSLPLHRSGSISLTLVQSTGSWLNPATVSYQFATKDGSKKSSVLQVVGNVDSKNTTLNFSDVPKGTASNPVFLIIVNKTPKNSAGNTMQIYGNGYTTG